MKRATKLACIGLALASVLAIAPRVPAQGDDAVKRVGKRMMCLCGCNQVLVECNHVGCSVSAAMIGQLKERVARKESDDLILQAFIQEYGQKVLAEPPAQGFNLAAWVMPIFVLFLGSIVVMVVLSRMSRQAPAVASGGPAVSVEALERLRNQADRESEG